MIVRFIRGIGRHIRDAFKSFFRNFGLSLSALASINVTLIVVSASILIGLNFDSFATSVESEVKIKAYVMESYDDSEMTTIESELKEDERIISIEYSSKQDELEMLKEQMPSIEEIASQYEGEENPLSRAFYVQVDEAKNIADVVEDMEGTGYFDEVQYGKEYIDKVVQLFYFARVIVLILIGCLLLVTVFIISNTLRITIYTRSTEIQIMKLIGASNYHIRMPYIYEGILIGLFGSCVPVLITIFGYKYFYDEYADSEIVKAFIDLVEPEPFTYYIAAGLLIIGVVVGVFGSAISVRRHIRK